MQSHSNRKLVVGLSHAKPLPSYLQDLSINSFSPIGSQADMAQEHTPALTGALTACPDILRGLKIEPELPVNTPSGVIAKNSSLSRSAVSSRSFGGLVRWPIGSVPIFPDISKITLGINSPQFYSAIGAAVAIAQPMQQVVAQANKVNEDYPSLWYVNFPKHMSAKNADMVQRYRQSMLDFRSWSSMKWWQEVTRRLGNPNDIVQRVQQSKEFAKIACEDMVKMSWLRTTKSPYEARHQIDCAASELHQNLIARALTGWSDVDRDTFDAIEPLFQDIVRSAQQRTQNFSELKVVIAEKYVYDSATDSITSYIRLICFELREAFYNVILGKGMQSQSRVNLELSLLQYEAVFEVSLWDQYSDSLRANEKDLFQDFIKRQTIDIK